MIEIIGLIQRLLVYLEFVMKMVELMIYELMACGTKNSTNKNWQQYARMATMDGSDGCDGWMLIRYGRQSGGGILVIERKEQLLLLLLLLLKGAEQKRSRSGANAE